MPVYEYYCPICNGRFSHLAWRYDELPPPCPGCGSRDVEKLVSRIHLGRSDAERRADFDARSREVNREDLSEIARFLQDAGSMADEMAPVERDAFREIVTRRAEGAGDEDLQDVVDAVPLIQPHDYEHEHEHSHSHEHGRDETHGHDHSPPKKHSPRRAKDLGWA